MAAISTQPPFPIFADTDGQPLDDGYIYIGVAGLDPITNPIATYWDPGLSQIAAQPLRTSGGYITNFGTPAVIYVNAVDYSITVQDKNHGFVYNSPNVTSRVGGIEISGGIVSADDITFIAAGAGAITRTGTSKMRDWVSAMDYGAIGNGIANDVPAINAALSAARVVYLPPPPIGYKCLSTIIVPDDTSLFGESRDGVKIIKAFNGPLMTLALRASVRRMNFDDLGVAFTGDGVHIPTVGVGRQEVSDIRSTLNGSLVHFDDGAGVLATVSNCFGQPASPNYLIQMDDVGLTGSSRTINGCWTFGSRFIDFGDSTLSTVIGGGGPVGAVNFGPNSDGINLTGLIGMSCPTGINGTRHSFTGCSRNLAVNVNGSGHMITGWDVGVITLTPGTTECTIVGVDNPIVDNSGNTTNRLPLHQITDTYTVNITTSGLPFSLADGTKSGRYALTGKICNFFIKLTLGASTNMGTGAVFFSLPFLYGASPSGGEIIGNGIAIDLGGAIPVYTLAGEMLAGPSDLLVMTAGGGTLATVVTNLNPFTFSGGDEINISGSYIIQ